MGRLSASPQNVVESAGHGSTMWKRANWSDVESLYDPSNTFRLISETARRAFNMEVLPNLERFDIFTVSDLTDVYEYFRNEVFPNALSGQDHPTYVRLVHHKSVDSTDTQFFEDLTMVLDSWYERFRNRLEQRKSGHFG